MKITLRKAVAAAVAALLIIGLGWAMLEPSDSGRGPVSKTLTVHVDGLDAGKAPDRTITVPQATVAAAAPQLEAGLQSESPAVAPAADLDAARAAADEIAATLPALPTAGATAGFAGCRTSFVRNQSSRNGVRPTMQTLHYTVSPNVPGWADVNAVVALFDRSSSQASSNFVYDAEGHCAYIVPIEAKAWTQAAGNPFSVSYEIIATGRESTYLPPVALRKLAGIMREVSRRTGIPMRAGAVRNCVPTRTGIVEHRAWGLCGGGHVDITPFSVSTIVGQLVAGVPKPVTGTDRVTCRKLNWWRVAGRPQGATQRNASRRKAVMTRRGVTCTPHGPVKR